MSRLEPYLMVPKDEGQSSFPPKTILLFKRPFKLKPFEEALAELEVSGVLAAPVLRVPEGLKVELDQSPSFDLLRGISSYATIDIDSTGARTSIETDQSLMERTAPFLRTWNDF